MLHLANDSEVSFRYLSLLEFLKPHKKLMVSLDNTTLHNSRIMKVSNTFRHCGELEGNFKRCGNLVQ